MTSWYAIIGEDADDSLKKRVLAREDHIARLKLLQAEGRLLLAGPFPAIDSADPGPAGYTGSLIVAEFQTLQEAWAWAENDPYLLTGVYAHVKVQPFKKVFPS